MASLFGLESARYLVPPGPLQRRMANSQGTGLPLVGRGRFAADLVRFASGQGVRLHVHPGDHILFVVSGSGLLYCAGERFSLTAGVCYFVPGNVPHSLEADAGSELTLISVANDHRPVDSSERLELVDG